MLQLVTMPGPVEQQLTCWQAHSSSRFHAVAAAWIPYASQALLPCYHVQQQQVVGHHPTKLAASWGLSATHRGAVPTVRLGSELPLLEIRAEDAKGKASVLSCMQRGKGGDAGMSVRDRGHVTACQRSGFRKPGYSSVLLGSRAPHSC